MNDDDDQIDITVTLNGREEDEGKVFDVGSGFENKNVYAVKNAYKSKVMPQCLIIRFDKRNLHCWTRVHHVNFLVNTQLKNNKKH